MSETTATDHRNGDSDKPRNVVNNRGLTQAYEIRDLAAREALALKNSPAKDTKESLAIAKALSDLTRVWDTASERIRIIRGRALPGSLRPAAKPKARSKSIAAVEVKPTPVVPDPPAQPGIEAKPGE